MTRLSLASPDRGAVLPLPPAVQAYGLARLIARSPDDVPTQQLREAMLVLCQSTEPADRTRADALFDVISDRRKQAAALHQAEAQAAREATEAEAHRIRSASTLADVRTWHSARATHIKASRARNRAAIAQVAAVCLAMALAVAILGDTPARTAATVLQAQAEGSW